MNSTQFGTSSPEPQTTNIDSNPNSHAVINVVGGMVAQERSNTRQADPPVEEMSKQDALPTKTES